MASRMTRCPACGHTLDAGPLERPAPHVSERSKSGIADGACYTAVGHVCPACWAAFVQVEAADGAVISLMPVREAEDS